MSLLRELQDPGSPVGRYLAGRFPDRTRTLARWDRALSGRPLIAPPGPAERTPVDRAFAYRLGYAFRLDPPYAAIGGVGAGQDAGRLRRLAAGCFPSHGGDAPPFARALAGHRHKVPPTAGRLSAGAPESDRGTGGNDLVEALAEFFGWFASLPAHLMVHNTPLPAQLERDLCRACYVFAVLEQRPRLGVDAWPGLAPGALGERLRVGDLDGLVPEADLADLEALAAGLAGMLAAPGWRRFVEQGPELVTVAPLFVEDWAEADLVAGPTLVDADLSAAPALELVRLDHLLVCALLDRGDWYGIARVGVWLGRRAMLVDADLQELLAEASGQRRLDLDAVRAELAEIVFAAHPRLRGRWATGQPSDPTAGS
jgi:hypothetical protein